MKYSNYNIYAIIFFYYFYYVYWQLITNPKYKKWIIYGTIITFCSYAVSTIFQNPLDTNLYYALGVGSYVLVFCIGLYFKEKMDKSNSTIQHNLMFWVSISLFIFYSIFPILYVIGYTDYQTWINYGLRSVLKLLIVIKYTLLIIGFLKGRKLAFR